ncbi:hypothetical protein [Pediococcus argentinicus]|uniref:Acetyl-CoA carboxylase n=1 Tax=Pediococcus argentinicus TaxID=480391 RepID=A0A0R2NH07_9LACO|nr:hypothetical protein [Pediococcus argentinicus]KRO25102.1 hypothetical protein IV88_GL000435 [Pediococcus argentinicus]NKZ22554.1 acetyl-CoA carboxylase [Pediococcus argentinicus]GEP19608.1 hypothetical protein LSA03_09920 [Pediococcus argentinicus]
MNDDISIIWGRVEQLFKHKYQTMYWIEVYNDRFDDTYNFFFYAKEKFGRQRSIPLHTVKDYHLEHLEGIIDELKKRTQLTIKFGGFDKLYWPKSQKLIQRKASEVE